MWEKLDQKFTFLLIVAPWIVPVLASQNPIIVDNIDMDCNSILSSMGFLNHQRCVQFIFGHEPHSIQCARTIMENSLNVTFYTRTLAWLIHRNIYAEETRSAIVNRRSTRYCDFFLIILKDLNSLQSVLKSLKRSAWYVSLFPYTKLYFMFVDKQSQSSISQTFSEISIYFRENAQFGYAFVQTNTNKIELKDFLSLNDTSPSTLIHPFVNQNNDQKMFRVSAYNCNPHVIYVNENEMRFDGVEYRLVREITKSWKIQHILRDKPHLGKTPFETTIDDLKNYTSDLAMCSVWLTGFDKKIDTSTHYSRQCGTLMVPKPKHLSKITAIYRTLKLNSWLTFGLFFFIVVILLRTSATFFHVSQSLHSDLSGSFLDVMNIATAHGAASLWKQQPRSTKILLMSWTFVCSLLGICYATIYTSYLAKPGYEKLINSVEDFVENDMYFGSFRIAPDLQSSLNASSIPSYHNLLKRFHVFASISDAETDLASRKFGIYAGIEYKKYFVSYSWIKHMNLISSFRLINKLCIFNYYTVFGLQKFSPYTELFSKYALQFQEHGITDFWYDTIYRQKNISFDSFFEDYPRESKEPIALQFASISGAILVLLVSHTISIVVFVCELGVKYSQQSYRLQY